MVNQNDETAPARGPLPRARLSDVAALAHTSVKTASRALNGHPNVSDEMRARVLEAARRLQFRPNALARELRSGAVSSGVGLVVADLANPFFSTIAAAAEKALRPSDLELFLASTDEDPQREQQVVRAMFERRARALLLVPAADDHSYLASEALLGTPLVFLDRPPVNLLADSIVSNDREAADQAFRSLAAHHEKILVVADEQTAWTARERLSGVALAVDGLGGTRGGAVSIKTGVHSADEARQVTAEALASDPPTAILALNNLLTMGVLMALRDTGSQATVLGIDDADALDLLGVSAVALDAATLGRTAALRAVARLADPDLPVERTVLPMTAVLRTPLDQPVRVPRAHR